MDVEATTAIRQAEVGAARTMIARTADQFEVTPSRLAADAGDGWSTSAGSNRTCGCSTSRSARTARFCAATSPTIRKATATFAQAATTSAPVSRRARLGRCLHVQDQAADRACLGRDAVCRAYARAEFWDEWIKMMQWWSDRLDRLKKSRLSRLKNS